ncbi:hypothetical protein RHMOL_Rhmol13G0275600 [Rhododendron molle]|uniref:Uncharacterized protein n=1 Tax=Rhododendron molle TaxID=49168 RepID=A0ACC0LBC4_RHOML|nr:hypothetical protein RHMOL_Rhmol13G0275600 [Rhododendron molle]
MHNKRFSTTLTQPGYPSEYTTRTSQRLCYLRELKYVANFHPYDVSFKSDAGERKPAELHRGGAAVHGHGATSGQRRPPVAQCVQRADVHKGGVRDAAGEPAVERDSDGPHVRCGYFDDVPTPVQGVPNPDGIVSPGPDFFDFDRLGVRVPTMVVSPWIEKGTVVHGPNGVPTATSEYEHSSIPATVKNIFNLPSFLTNMDAWAGSFDDIVQTRQQPRTDCPGTYRT